MISECQILEVNFDFESNYQLFLAQKTSASVLRLYLPVLESTCLYSRARVCTQGQRLG